MGIEAMTLGVKVCLRFFDILYTIIHKQSLMKLHVNEEITIFECSLIRML